ncbi:circadian clock-controlled protein daywake-like [Haematobia irritans]|uniref:circadian clock-controlled protein daywake-like n=1 Tax=Haematobia irritans TaxID=7368 RepID=UPI003F50BBC5
MLNHILTVIIIISLSLGCYGGDLPADISKCKMEDNVCIRDKIMEIFKKFPNGNPSFGMPNIAELPLKNIVVARANNASPIQLNFKYLELLCYGIDKSIIVNTTGWTKDPKTITTHIHVPLMRIVGDYEAGGKILLLSLNGGGKGIVELTDCQVVLKCQVHLEKRNDGKMYLVVTKARVNLQPKKVFIQMDGLVKGSQELTNSLNKVLNDSWMDAWNEISDGVNNALAKIFYNIISQILNEIPYDDFYAK